MTATYTPIEQRILGLLSNGKAHTRGELLAVVYPDGYGTYGNLRNHLSNLRKKLIRNREDVLNTRKNGTTYYQHVRLITTSD